MNENNKKTDLSDKSADSAKNPAEANTSSVKPTSGNPPQPTSTTSPSSDKSPSSSTDPTQKTTSSTPAKSDSPSPKKPSASEAASAARSSLERAAKNSATREASSEKPKSEKPSSEKSTSPASPSSSPSSPSSPAKPSSPTPSPASQNTSLETTKATEVEALAPLKKDHSASLAQPMKPVSKWAFWKKAKQRDEQLIRISEGYVEMVDMVRSIRDQAEAQHQNNLILRDTLAHLPSAIKSLEGFGKSHAQVGSALEKINEQMENHSRKDERMADTMNGFNDTLIGMNGTSKATIKTFDRVQERMRESDDRMENLFANVRQSEEEVSKTMTRLQRNMSIFQTFFLLCLLGIIGGLIWLFINRDDFTNSANKMLPAQTAAIENREVGSPDETLTTEEPQAEEPQAEEPQAEEPQAEEPQAEEPVI